MIFCLWEGILLDDMSARKILKQYTVGVTSLARVLKVSGKRYQIRVHSVSPPGSWHESDRFCWMLVLTYRLVAA